MRPIAIASVYPAPSHWIMLSLPCSSVRIDGPAIVVTSASRRSITSAARMTARAHQRQRYGAPEAAPSTVVLSIVVPVWAVSTDVVIGTPE
jgi:hypothetical protein